MNADFQLNLPESLREAIVASYPTHSADAAAQLDRLASLAARLCGAPAALVSLVEKDRQVFVGRSGTELTETPRSQSFCAHAMLGDDCLVVPDATKDPRFADNPLVTGPPYIRFYAGQPLQSFDGAPLGSFCIIDTKPREGLSRDESQVLATLGESVMAMLERWRLEKTYQEQHDRNQSKIHNLEQRFQVLADGLPQLVWSTKSDGLAVYFNRGWCDYTGHPPEECFGTAWLKLVHPDDLETTEQAWTAAVAGERGYEVEYRLRRHDGQYRWMLARGRPIRDRAGRIDRWVGTCTDIHERKEAAEQQLLLSRELNHRIKNIFAVIGGLMALSARQNPDAADTLRALQARVLSLGRAHDLVRISSDPSAPGDRKASIELLLDALLSPYDDGDSQRFRIDGADILIDDRAATPLALFFHELATNAAKYGALSVPEGRVEISVQSGEMIVLGWRESGGPAVVPAAEQGFGSRLIEMSVTRQLGGELRYDWLSDGVFVEARIPASAMTR
ncbi:MAG: PAS domain-containing protein [Novosphingobium sp.]|nr:PAS domain-containing protein [Novosphingobium sp.]